MKTVTRLAGPPDLERAAEVLGDAFADYPWTRWTVDGDDHQRRVIALHHIALEHYSLRFGAVSVTTVDRQIQSVAAWIDSAALSAGTVETSVAQRVAELEGSRHRASISAERQVEHRRPDTRHLYLGARPRRRGCAVDSRTAATAPHPSTAVDRPQEPAADLHHSYRHDSCHSGVAS